MFATYFFFVAGLILIIKGGDYFVDSATWIARVTQLPEVIIGATIVSLATTFPETMVSTLSVIQGQPSMAIGNAIGSTICNTGLVLGLYNLIKPSKVESSFFSFKGLLMIFYLLFFWILSKNRVIGLSSSIILLLLLFVYILFNICIVRYKKQDKKKLKVREIPDYKESVKQVIQFIFGIVLILFGADLLITHGVTLAKAWGVPEAIISLTLISLGTSLPELVTAITALFKGHSGLSIGNIIGANILNICMVIGVSSQFGTLEITDQTYYFDTPVSIIINLFLILPTIFTKKIGRLQSVILLVGYFTYILILFN